MSLAARVILETLCPAADRQEPVGPHLAIFVRRLQRLVVEGVVLGALVARRPDHRLMGVGEATAAKVRHWIIFAPDDVVQDPEPEILHDRADAKNIVVRADDENRRRRLHHPARLREPVAREGVIGGEIREFVPVIIDRIDQTLIRAMQTIGELQIIGRIGEDEIDALLRQSLH